MGTAAGGNGSNLVSWTRQFGSSEQDDTSSVAVDATGVYVAGSTSGSLPGTTSSGETDVFLKNYDLSGNDLWTRQFGTATYETPYSIAVDFSGVYVAGFTLGNLAGLPQGTFGDAFLRKYDLEGTELWTRQFGTPNGAYGRAIAVHGTGLFLLGDTYDALPGQTSAGLLDAFLRRYDRDGNELWTRQFGSPLHDFAKSVAVDATGVYAAGDTLRGSPPHEDAFLRKFDLDGNELWAREFGSVGVDFARSVAVDASGVYVAVQTSEALDGYTNAGGTDAFLRKYDVDGNELWTRQVATLGHDFFWSVAVREAQVFIAGFTDSAFPGQTSAGRSDAVLRMYDLNGNERWTHQFGTSEHDLVWSVSVAGTGMYLAGATDGSFPGQVNAGKRDAFLRKYHPLEPPGAPTDVTATPGEGEIVLSWAPPLAGRPPPTHYRIYRGLESSPSFFEEIGTFFVYNDTAVSLGIVYAYQVSAVNAVGEGERSNTATAVLMRPPDAPIALWPSAGVAAAVAAAVAVLFIRHRRRLRPPGP